MEVLTLRRISSHTGKYVPVFRPQEIDDYSKPERLFLPIPTYGSAPIPSRSANFDLAMVQGDVFSQDFQFDTSLIGKEIKSQVRINPETGTVSAEFAVTITNAANGLVNLSLTEEQTRRLPLRAYWDMELSDTGGTNSVTVVQGRVYCQREVTRG